MNSEDKAAPRTHFILSIWPQGETEAPSVWRGYIETGNGRRCYFATLHQLNQLLRQHGWQEDSILNRKL